MIIYLHGFRSAPASIKAQALKARMTERGLADRRLGEFLDRSTQLGAVPLQPGERLGADVDA